MDAWSALKTFEVETNNLQGTIPDLVGLWWPELEYFTVSENAFTSSIPESVGQWSNLILFWAATNKLNSTLPVAIGQWVNLEDFDVREVWHVVNPHLGLLIVNSYDVSIFRRCLTMSSRARFQIPLGSGQTLFTLMFPEMIS